MSTGNVVLAPSSNAIFAGTKTNDMLVYTAGSSQTMYIGNSGASNFIKVNSNIISIIGNLDVSGALTKNGITYSSGGGGFSGSSINLSGAIGCSYLSVTNGATQSVASSSGSSSTVAIGTGTGLAVTSISGDSSNDLNFSLVSSNQYANILVYNSNGSTCNEVFRVGGNGYVGILTSNPAYPLDVVGTARATSVLYTSLQQTSDRRVKENVKDVDHIWANNVIQSLEVVDYNFIGNSKNTIGFIAQQVGEVLPLATNTCADFIPIEAIQVTIDGDSVLHLTSLGSASAFVIGDTFKFKSGAVDGDVSEITIVKAVDAYSFGIAGAAGVVGVLTMKKVYDFKTMDYQAITACLVSTVQLLQSKVTELEKKINEQA